MFAKTIVDSDAFLDMPMSARLLYYDLALRADDDGFVNSPKKIMRTIGASQEDLDVLLKNKFIIGFSSGVIVIKHWFIHNYIRKDTYNATPYTEERTLLKIDKNKAYTLAGDDSCTNSKRTVDVTSTQVRLDKVRSDKDKDSIDPSSAKAAEDPPSEEPVRPAKKVYDPKFEQFWNAYPKVRRKAKRDAEKAFLRIKDTSLEEMLEALERQKKSADWKKDNGKFIPYPSTWLNGRRWEDDMETPSDTSFPKLSASESLELAMKKLEQQKKRQEAALSIAK